MEMYIDSAGNIYGEADTSWSDPDALVKINSNLELEWKKNLYVSDYTNPASSISQLHLHEDRLYAVAYFDDGSEHRLVEVPLDSSESCSTLFSDTPSVELQGPLGVHNDMIYCAAEVSYDWAFQKVPFSGGDGGHVFAPGMQHQYAHIDSAGGFLFQNYYSNSSYQNRVDKFVGSDSLSVEWSKDIGDYNNLSVCYAPDGYIYGAYEDGGIVLSQVNPGDDSMKQVTINPDCTSPGTVGSVSAISASNIFLVTGGTVMLVDMEGAVKWCASTGGQYMRTI